MQPQSAQDYQNLLTEVIKKQIVILGPDITLSKARNVKGLTVQDDGTVTQVNGSPQEVTQALIDQFVQLSGLIVKKTMEPLLRSTQELAQQSSPTPQTPQQPVTPIAESTIPEPTQVPSPTSPTPVIQPEVPTASVNPPTIPQPEQQATQPIQEVQSPVEPAKNPLAA